MRSSSRIGIKNKPHGRDGWVERWDEQPIHSSQIACLDIGGSKTANLLRTVLIKTTMLVIPKRYKLEDTIIIVILTTKG